MKNLFFIGFLLLFILSCGGDETTGANDNESKDPNMEKCVRKKADKLEGELTVEDVKDIETLDCPRMNIKVLDGIEKLPNVSKLYFYENDIVDLSILKNIETLKVLRIEHNKNINPNTLSELIGLEELHAEECGLTTLDSIKNLSDLKVLSVASNSLDSLEGLENLTDLTQLSARANKIASLEPVRNLTSLIEFRVGLNRLNSLEGLENLTDLKFLILNKNYLENDDLPVLLNLDKLEHLNIEYNCVTDFSVFDQMKGKNPDLEIVYGGLNEECY